MPDSGPQHEGSHHANTVHDWMPSDSHERWLENCKDPVQRQRLQQHGWLPERAITYAFNSHGFRCAEFDDRPSVLCLGCSHTMGMGLPVEQTWPCLLQQRVQINCWNLGVAGCALDTVFRMVNHYVHVLNAVAVMCLVPEIKRFEIFSGGRPHIENCVNPAGSPMYRAWMNDDQNADINQTKNLLAMQQICNSANVPLVYTPWRSGQHLNSKARDLLHPGHAFQCDKAKEFQSLWLLQKT